MSTTLLIYFKAHASISVMKTKRPPVIKWNIERVICLAAVVAAAVCIALAR
jgi:hypothetical protein